MEIYLLILRMGGGPTKFGRIIEHKIPFKNPNKITYNMTKHRDIQTLFGELRSHIYGDSSHSDWGIELIDILTKARNMSPTDYYQYWLPYLDQQSLNWPQPICTFRDPSKLDAMLRDLQTPGLFGLDIGARNDAVVELSEFNNPNSICELCMSGWDLTESKISEFLVALGKLRNLTKLNLNSNLFGCNGFVRLLELKSLDHLAKIDVSANEINECEVDQLSHLSLFNQLISIDISFNATKGTVLRSVMLSQQNKIKEFVARKCKIPGDRLRVPTANDRPSGIAELDLFVNNIGDCGASFIASQPFYSTISKLDIGANNISMDGLSEICNSTTLLSLNELNLWLNKIGDSGAQTIANSKNMTHLTKLNLRNTNIGDSGFASLVSSSELKNLVDLNVSQNNISLENPTYLVHLPEKSSIRRLSLSSNRIDDQGARVIADHLSLENLEFLDLHYNNITTEGIQYILASKRLYKLKKIVCDQDDKAGKTHDYFNPRGVLIDYH